MRSCAAAKSVITALYGKRKEKEVGDEVG
jgi:hypothetical protein